MKNLIFPALIILFTTCAFAQDETTPKLRISDIQIQGGIQNLSPIQFDLNDFNTLAPGSPFLATDFSDFSAYRLGGYSDGMFAVTVGLTLPDKEKGNHKANPTIRVGVFNSRSTSGGLYYSKSDYFPYDTLTSSASGQQFFIDSVHTSTYRMKNNSEYLGLTAAIQYSTNPERRVFLYGGVGIVAACSFNNVTTVENEEYSSFDNSNPTYNNVYNYYPYPPMSNWNSYDELHENKTSTFYSAGIPLGIDFRLAKAHPFWRQIHLTWEIKPSVSLVNIPELKSYANTGIATTWGFRVTW